MRLLLPALVAALFALPTSAAPTPQVKAPNPIVKAPPSEANANVVQLYTGAGLCAGSMLSNRLIITAWHCVSGMHSIQAKWMNGHSVDSGIEVVARDDEFDLALLRLPEPYAGAKFFKMPDVKEALVFGEPVLVIGHPNWKLYTESRGKLLMIGDDYLASDANVDPGNSGGPMIDSKGRLIGVTVIKYQLVKGRQIGDFVSYKRVLGLMQRAGVNPEPLGWTAARGGSFLDFYLLRDGHVDAMSQHSRPLFAYSVGYIFFDRIHVAFKQTLFRPESVRAWQIGYKFQGTYFSLMPSFERDFYSGPALHGAAYSAGATLGMFSFLKFGWFEIWSENQRYSAWLLGF